jgi:hypothetical protein
MIEQFLLAITLLIFGATNGNLFTGKGQVKKIGAAVSRICYG